MSEIKSAEYWVHKGQVKLYVYRKRAAGTGPGAPVLFLVHGSSASGRNSFDLSVPGRSDYSLMNHFAGLGYDVWTMDHEGYGRSDRTTVTRALLPVRRILQRQWKSYAARRVRTACSCTAVHPVRCAQPFMRSRIRGASGG